MESYDILEVLKHIDPARLDYTEWLSVGMALKDAGYAAQEWESWSASDARHEPGECFQKWNTFHGSTSPITAGTIVQFAKNQGWIPPRSTANDRALDWDDIIAADDDSLVIIDESWVEGQEIAEPETWDPAQQIITYLETLFEPSENVGYVTETWLKDGRYVPTKGCYDRTAERLIQELRSCKGDIGAVFGDYKEEAGAWIRFNPLDGNGVKNENVTEYRYALVESDDMTIDKQNAMIRELELPVACLVYSGGKSLHAIVKINASSYDEYRQRVEYLYSILKKNGMSLDTQNKNPSRLSRMPGIIRKDRKQFIVDTNIGKASWEEWSEWVEGVNDNLPDPENLSVVWDHMPELSPPLIDGVLRQGHKMLIAGPSKAGKSYALIEMCIAIAEGRKWLSWPCTKGRVLYVNLELDRPSCLHRFRDVYEASALPPCNISNIDIWNLRGNSVPMDKLAPKLIRRAAKKDYIAVIIDPIYKVITGDENSADQMAHFCNQFDKVCNELGCAVIYCHHHSKGAQGGKRSMDRASGSGVFARDPDALLDLIELELSEELQKQEENKAVYEVCARRLDQYSLSWREDVSQDDMCSETAMLNTVSRILGTDRYAEMLPYVYRARQSARARTAWRIDGTLREFPKFKPVNLWFDYPVHTVEQDGALQDMDIAGEASAPWQKAKKQRKSNKKDEAKKEQQSFENAVENCNFGDPPTIKNLSESLGLSERTVWRKIEKYDYEVKNGKVFKKKT